MKNPTRSTRRQAVAAAQAIADRDQVVMVVIAGTVNPTGVDIRPAADLVGFGILESADWMSRAGLTYLSVVAPAGSYSGLSAQQILEAVIR